jgi:nitrogen regulatory protein PII
MKMITAIIKPLKFDNIHAALEEIGVTGFTVTEVQTVGRQGGRTELYRGKEYTTRLQMKIKLEIAVADQQLDEVIRVITHAASGGRSEDCKLFVTSLEETMRVRAGEAYAIAS